MDNLAFHTVRLQQLAFEEIPTGPSIQQNTELHEARRKIAILAKDVANMLHWMPSSVRDDVAKAQREGAFVWFPDDAARQVISEAKALDQFVMDTFQLLMSTISVLAAESGLDEARSAQKLMWLASVYLPLTMVTGIFGMNIREVNDSLLPWWACLLALVAMVGFTGTILFVFDKMADRRRGNKGYSIEVRKLSLSSLSP
ncbi:uncharacterized protein B0I36DRAFT_316695 [Microdochium trichocladiopsis]|uniref:Uncharacterized protein n=1 Tax=Microdochium trichocladiopsis TaxID=1682393 RepID=A0A9P9BQ96_9PEZI|nr:uncharacterized protein B0I36DRAFT_316695 [Microdochium trichocladiopsis]KAH7034648.1 hypothetical protein B0I36DRAFT_316695 [Microdochium trichocladiopsis]